MEDWYNLEVIDGYTLRRMTGDQSLWGDKGAVALAEILQSVKGNVSNLKTLSLRFFKLGDKGLVALAKSFELGYVSNLTTLDLSYNEFRDEGVVALAKSFESGHVSKLTTLYLYSNWFGDEGVVALAKSFQSGHVSNLTTLNVCHNYCGDEGMVALAKSFESGHVSNLTTLELIWKNCGDEGVVALAKSFESGHVSNLTTLNLSSVKCGDKGVVALAKSFQSGHASNLTTLDLSFSDFRDKGVVALAKSFESGHVNNLTTFDLTAIDVGNKGLVALAKSFQLGHMSKLENIALKSIDIKLQRGLFEIAKTLEAGWLPSLRELKFSDWGCAHGMYMSRAAEQAFVRAYQNNTSLVVQIMVAFVRPEGSFDKFRKLQVHNEKRVKILRALQDEPNVPGTHGKVFLCGNPCVGKTTLRRSLARKWKPDFLERREEERTRGIEVSRIVSKNFSNGKPLMLAIWDLAGQQEYHILHSAFLPDLAIADGQATFFVIVCSASTYYNSNSSVQAAEHELRYWLRFISSNAAKQGEISKRQVFVVLNCFRGDRSGHKLELWTDILAECGQKFADCLAIYPRPFIFDATIAKEVKALKSELKRQSKGTLQKRQMPQICQDVQEASREWANHPDNIRYPILAWRQYSLIFFSNITEEKLEAATKYLHETGHLIHIKEGALIEGRLPHEALVILDPDWFCRKVVGQVLLPDGMLNQGEMSLRRKLAADGSLPWSTLQRMLDIPADKCEEVVAILLRLGLCYRAFSETDKIFVPALMEGNPEWPPTEACNISPVDQAWVMGFSLVVEDSSTTLLPIVIFRKLQVELAQDTAINGRADCDYLSGESRITFKSEGMNVLVEFGSDFGQGSPKPQDWTPENRLDILVKPMVYDGTNNTSVALIRDQQVHLASTIVDRVLRISEDCCPGVTLVRKIVRPWSSTDIILKSMQHRDVTMSVEDVIARVKKNGNLETTLWNVGSVMVKEDELLCRGDLEKLWLFVKARNDCMNEAAERLGLSNPSEDEDDVDCFGLSNTPEVSDDLFEGADVQTAIVLRHVSKQVGGISKQVHGVSKQVHDVSKQIEQVRDSLHQALKQQTTVLHTIQSLERFSTGEKESSVPRYAYLAETGNPSKWMTLKGAFAHNFTLHFLCEAPHDGQTLHEVDGQAGIDISRLKDWAKKLAPVLDWSLKLAFFTAKIAGSAVLPGLGLLIPNLSPGLIDQAQISNTISIINGIVDPLQYSSTTLSAAQSRQSVLDSQADGLAQSRSKGRVASSNRRTERQLRGVARATVKQVLDGLSPQEFDQQVGLRRVKIRDSGGYTQHVVWICQKCCNKYGSRAIEI